MEGLITFSIMIIAILTSVPIAFAMIAVSLFAYIIFAHMPAGVVAQNMFYNIQSYSYSAIPYFILAGNVMARGGIAKQLIDIAEAFVGFFPSGMAIAVVVGCALFGTITGSDVATVAAIGGIMFPVLTSRGWPKPFVAGIIGSSALLGMLIPPTIPGIIYALMAEVSVMKVFLSGVLPGIIIVIFFSVYISFMGKKMIPGLKMQRPNVLKMLRALKNGWAPLGVPVIIFGGIFGGIFTVTEAAAVAAAYALFLELLIHRGLKLRDIPGLLIETGMTTSICLFLVSAAMVLGRFLTLEQIPQMWADEIFSVVHSKWIFMLVVNLFLFVTGCLVDIVTGIVVLVPVFKPLYIKFGLNEIYFASVFLLNMYIGYLTPPVGINLFVVSAMFGVSYIDCVKAYLPFIFLMSIALILVILFPWLSIWLPNLLVR